MSDNAARERRRAATVNAAADRRDAWIVARVVDDGATLDTVAREVGLSRERIRQIVQEDSATAVAELAALDADEAALMLRYRQALEIVDTLDAEGRLELLASVILPGDELLAASRAQASAQASARRTFSANARSRALELVAAGMSWAAAASEVGASKPTVGDWVRKAAGAERRIGEGRCKGCGIAFADGETQGCRMCGDRRRNKLRRAEAREHSASLNGGAR